MEELVSAIIAAIVEIIFEFFLESLFAGLAGLLSRAFRIFRVQIRKANPVIATAVFGVVGGCFGILSVWLLPHRLVHPMRLRGISLVISPILTGLLMSQIGSSVKRRGGQPVRIETFTYGFVFALAFSLVRYWSLY